MSDLAPESSGRRVAVLGAGLAGLRAARELVRTGGDVTVFEARRRVGGRITGQMRDGSWADASWPVLGGRDAAMARFAQELGLADAIWPLRPVQTTLLRDGETQPVDGLSLSGAARIPGPRFYERPKLLRYGRLHARYAPLLSAMYPERAADLDYRSIRDHVSLYFGRGALEFWLTPELQSTYGDAVEELSRAALLQHCAAVGIGEHRPGMPGLPRRPLTELLEAAAEDLHIRFETAVERVDEEPSGGFRVEATNGSGAHHEELFDSILVALGPQQAAQVCHSMLTPAERDFFEAVEERPVITLSVTLEGIETGLPQEIRLPRREGSAIASMLVEPGQISGRVAEGQTQIVLLARDAFARRWSQMADDVVAKSLLSSLELTMPGVGSRLISTLLGRATVPFFAVGSYRRLATFQKVQADRRALGRGLYWAGDYLGGGSFEAAALSGLRAARSLAEDVS